MEASDLNYYKESEHMIVLPCQNGHKSGVIVLFDNMNASIVTARQVGDLGGEQAKVKVWAADDA